MRKIDFRSDTVTKPTDEMREAMFRAKVGDDVFDEDPTIHELQDRVAEILGKEAALYVPSGTMANQIALKILTQPGDEVYCEAGCHFFNFESGAPAFVSGVQLHPIEGNFGVFTREQVEEVLRPPDHHFPPSSVIAVENTHNRCGGTVWMIREMHRLYELTRENGMSMHLDGARLWHAAVASGTPEKDWAQYADTVSVCFSKGLGAPVGSVLASTRELIDEAHRTRKRLGGGMRQAGIIAAGALYALDHHRDRLVEDHRRAKTLAKGLADIPGFYVALDHVDTNIVILDVSERAIEAATLVDALKKKGILITYWGKSFARFVTHLEITDQDVEDAVQIIREIYT